MKFVAIDLPGAWLVAPERREDPRGYFTRLHCVREFEAHGLPRSFVQSNLSYNRRGGSVRGLHFQWPPSQEGKLVRCSRGRVFDVLVDLRPDSNTFTQHRAVELVDDTGIAVFIPAGVAHGFQSLTDDTEVHYLMSDFYAPELTGGFRFDEPAFAISWPQVVTEMSDRDRSAPLFDARTYREEYARRSDPARARR